MRVKSHRGVQAEVVDVSAQRLSSRMPQWESIKPPFAYDGSWPGRAKAEFRLAAVNQSSKAGQQGKF